METVNVPLLVALLGAIYVLVSAVVMVELARSNRTLCETCQTASGTLNAIIDAKLLPTPTNSTRFAPSIVPTPEEQAEWRERMAVTLREIGADDDLIRRVTQA